MQNFSIIVSENSEIRKGLLNWNDVQMFKDIWMDSWIYQVIDLVDLMEVLWDLSRLYLGTRATN
jgi:hypothetical protein